MFFDKIKSYEVKKFENRKNKTTFIPPTQKVWEVNVVLVFRFEQLFINKNENVMGQLWQVISGQWTDYAPILFLKMKLPSYWGLHAKVEKISTVAKIFMSFQSWLINRRFFEKNRKFSTFRKKNFGGHIAPIDTYKID